MCKKAADTCTFMLDCVLDCYKTQKINEKSKFEKPNKILSS